MHKQTNRSKIINFKEIMHRPLCIVQKELKGYPNFKHDLRGWGNFRFQYLDVISYFPRIFLKSRNGTVGFYSFLTSCPIFLQIWAGV